MPTVKLDIPGKNHGYEVVIEPGAIDTLGERLAAVAPHARAGAVLDANIEQSHGRVALRALKRGGYDVTVGVMPATEKLKSLKTVQELLGVMLDAKLERKSPVVAVGGGIVGDTAGYVAASYLRGVPFVQVPTTLLAMVDASVGGKVGVNVPQGKNLVGAFHQPVLVCIDTDTLKTLPDRDLRCGLAECVKHGVIRDPGLFAWIEDNVDRVLDLQSDALVELVKRNVEIKAAVVAEDEKEQGVRAHLNFGHTFAHAIEASPAAVAKAAQKPRRKLAPPATLRDAQAPARGPRLRGPVRARRGGVAGHGRGGHAGRGQGPVRGGAAGPAGGAAGPHRAADVERPAGRDRPLDGHHAGGQEGQGRAGPAGAARPAGRGERRG